MKIIKQGKLPEEKVYRWTCRTCQTVFQFQKKEAKYNYDQRENEGWFTLKCPFCNENITLVTGFFV